MNYENDIKIDHNALDVEWLEQPRLMIRYAKILADAEREMDFAKSALEVTKAEVDKKIRSNPEKFDIAKITESVVSASILTSDEHKEAEVAYLDARHEFNILKGAVKAIDHRKEALENLVRLYGQQYFAGPSVPRDLGKEWQNKQEQKKANSSVAKKITRRR